MLSYLINIPIHISIPTEPHSYIKILDNGIEVNIPDMYIVDNNVSGNVLIDTYVT